jgi:hypothetical protein
MDIEQISILFVIVFFAAAEIRRALISETGVIEGFLDSGPLALFMPVLMVKVRLNNGDLVKANLNGCAACLGRLQEGDSVRVTRTNEGYCVDLPWTAKRNRWPGFVNPSERESGQCPDQAYCKGGASQTRIN